MILKRKKAFTLIEVVLALIVAAMASMYVLKSIWQNEYNSDVKEYQTVLKSIVEDGIISNVGYASGADNNCSPNYDFTNLTTQRLKDCLDWKQFSVDANGYLTGQGLMDNYNNCKFKICNIC
jgi:prepilin-type N-terminal cleavage/methylation domain-containing protein